MEYYISETNWSTILTFLTAQKGLHTKDIVVRFFRTGS
ncbi:hypothetical protein BBG19_0601 [Francisella sp. MA067296]|nr:hypothetical protein BBG19_0601 [Francisella sp. MA067296]